MSRRRLPIGIQTSRTLRKEGCYYVDKTPYLERLLDEGPRGRTETTCEASTG